MGSPRVDNTPYPGYSQDGMTNIRAAIPTASTVVTLTAPASRIHIQLDAASAALAVALHLPAGPAVLANHFQIPSGGSFVYQGPPLTSFAIIGATATGDYNVIAY